MKSQQKHLLSFVLLTVGLAFSLQAQVTLTTTWDTAGKSLGQRATIVIGDQIDIILSAPGSGTQPINFPKMDDFGQNDIVPVAQRYDTVKAGDGSMLQRQITTVTCFEVGKHALGGLPAALADGHGAWQTLTMNDSLYLTVNDYPGVDTTKADIKDIAAPLREPFTFWEIFRWVLLAAAAATIVLIVIHIVKSRKAHKPVLSLKPKTPPVPPRQQALRDLESLRQDHLWQRGKTKEYYTQLTDIIRNYLKRRYKVDSTEMTSDQTLDAFASCAGHSADRATLLRQMLRTADMVKFAKAEPQSYEHDQSLNDAVAFVSLEPEPPQPTSKAAASHIANSNASDAPAVPHAAKAPTEASSPSTENKE